VIKRGTAETEPSACRQAREAAREAKLIEPRVTNARVSTRTNDCMCSSRSPWAVGFSDCFRFSWLAPGRLTFLFQSRFKRINPFRRFGLRQGLAKCIWFAELLAQRFQVRRLRACHRFIARDPIVGILFSIG
jgi:hypothetical protein